MPIPNIKDALSPDAVKAHGTLSFNVASDASTPDEVSGLLQGAYRIIKSDTVTFLTADFSSSGNLYLTEVATKFITLPGNNQIFDVFFQDAAGYKYPLPFYDFNLDTGALLYQCISKVSADGATGIIEIRSTATLNNIPFRYYILSQSIV